jgi:hypothetical protein
VQVEQELLARVVLEVDWVLPEQQVLIQMLAQVEPQDII